MGMVQSAQLWLLLALALAGVGLAAASLIHAALMHPGSFRAAEKRTKGFWLAITGLCTVLAFLAIPPPLGLGAGGMLFSLAGLIGGGIYLADVRRAVQQAGGRRGPRRPGGAGGYNRGPSSWRGW